MARLWSVSGLVELAGMDLSGLYQFFKEGGHSGYNQPRAVSDDTTLLATDRLLLCDTTAAGFTVTLGSAKNYLPQPYVVKLMAGANNVTLDADGTELIYTNAGAGTLAWNTAGQSKVIIPCLVAAPGTWGWVEVNA